MTHSNRRGAPFGQWESADEQAACSRPLLGCPEFDSDVLAPFYGKVIRAIRQVDAETIVNYEPNGTSSQWVSGSCVQRAKQSAADSTASSDRDHVCDVHVRIRVHGLS